MTPNKELRNRMVSVASALRIDRPFSGNVMSDAIAELDRLTAENENLRAAAFDALHWITNIGNSAPVVRKLRAALEQP